MLDPLPRLKKMADKLQLEIDTGRLEGDFVESFISSVRRKMKAGHELTPRQIEILEDLFEKH